MNTRQETHERYLEEVKEENQRKRGILSLHTRTAHTFERERSMR